MEDLSDVDGDQSIGTDGATPGTGGGGSGEEELVDPATGVPLRDLMLSASHISTGVPDPDSDVADPDVDPPKRTGAPIAAGLHRVDFNDDDAVQDMIGGIVDGYEKAVKAAGLKMAPDGSLKLYSRGGVLVEEYHEIQAATEAEYRAVLSLVQLGEKFGDIEFLELVDAHIHKEMAEHAEAGLGRSVDAVRAALEWGDIDLSGVHMEDGTDVWEATATSLLSFEHREIEDPVPMMGLGDHSASAAMLDMGRGVTYLCFDSNPDTGIDDHEIFVEVAPNDWRAIQRLAVEAMQYAAISGEPLGKHPNTIRVGHPLTMDDVNSAFMDAICSDCETAREYAEWMEYGGHGVWPVDTTAERTVLADAYLAIATSGETG